METRAWSSSPGRGTEESTEVWSGIEPENQLYSQFSSEDLRGSRYSRDSRYSRRWDLSCVGLDDLLGASSTTLNPSTSWVGGRTLCCRETIWSLRESGVLDGIKSPISDGSVTSSRRTSDFILCSNPLKPDFNFPAVTFHIDGPLEKNSYFKMPSVNLRIWFSPRISWNHAGSIICSSRFPVLFLKLLEHLPCKKSRCKIQAKYDPEKDDRENVIS